MRLLPCGDAAVLVELPDSPHVLGLAAALRANRPAGVVDIVPAQQTVLVTLDPAVLDPAAAGALLHALAFAPQPLGVGPGPVREIAVAYDGADLAAVAELAGLDGPAEVVRRHCAPTYTVAFCGFVPGFGYLVGGDPVLAVPRLDSPRVRVPAGSVAVAGPYTGVYPRESPGGWRLLGRTDARLVDLAADPPTLLTPGTRVRFRPA